MTFAPTDFLSAYKTGFERPALFQAFFTDGVGLRYHIQSVNLPGVQLITDTFQHVPDTPKQSPIQVSYNTAAMSVLLDADGNAFDDLRERVARVVNPDTNAVSYAEDYLSNLIIFQYKEDGSLLRTTTLLDCYVTSVGDTPLDWSASDTASVVNVGLYYKKLNIT